ncbi:hypothetical protein [Micromonospora sp. LOL_023]|uniref:hypothetical protein n=1 Tax=Micromonospora sp. LOL_023 TaxID=3345418 RepID=UPI003A8A6DC0
MRTTAFGSRTRAPAASVTVVAVALLMLAVTGCTGKPQSRPEPTATGTPVAAEESQRLVQDYLDAMGAKDVDKGRAQLCPATQEIFDASATGPNGDFAESFLVERAEIVDSRTVPVGHEVTATVTAAVGSDTIRVGLVFTVTPTGTGDGVWCIHDETATEADQDSDTGPVGGPGTSPAGGPGAAPRD